METNLTIPFNAIKGLDKIREKDNLRPFVNQIHIEFNTDSTVIVATNRVIIMGIKIEAERDQAISVTLPETVIDKILDTKPGRRAKYTEIRFNKTNYEWKYEVNYLNVDGHEEILHEDVFVQAGDYPEWKRVFPEYVDGATSQIDPNLLMQAQKAAAAALGVKVSQPLINVHHNGESVAPFTVFGNDRIFGVINSLSRLKKVEYTKPF